ncbi:MAG TPA: gamma-glutamyltransferase [Alphaproteobacteria bacterium]|nr:gamma-glutamyltransferase [Alphaproteobacteria bacterium]
MVRWAEAGRGMLAGAWLVLSSVGCAIAPAPEPEGPGGGGTKAEAAASRHMIVAANPLAAEAGRAILRQGGSAVDAAIAAQLVLNLVEPQSSGIGGGGFLLHFEGASGRIEAYDGRETAPAAAEPGLFLDASGAPLPFLDAAASGLSVGVPGLLRLLERAHERHGRMAWERLFEPAIELAEEGFALSPRLHALLAEEERLQRDPEALGLYFDAAGEPLPVGTLIRNPMLAETFRAIATGGAEAFYSGVLAQSVVEAVSAHPERPGRLALGDLSSYRTILRDPVCGPYRVFIVCGMPPPSSGGIAVLQILALLERFPIGQEAPLSPNFAHLFAEAGRLAFADRGRYLADPDHVEVPVARLLDPAYLARRSQLIRPDRSLGKAQPGDLLLSRADPAPRVEPISTSHLSVVDDEGNAVALTSSIESGFGSRIEVGGFLLNNQLTDFSFEPIRDGVLVANSVAPGKRPLSSMAPTFVLDRDGSLVAVLGSPGGSAIIAYVAQAVIALGDWRMPPDEAAALPHLANRNGPTDLEKNTAAEALAPALIALGHEVRLSQMTSGLHIIRIEGGRILGGADPRREGVALGD